MCFRFKFLWFCFYVKVVAALIAVAAAAETKEAEKKTDLESSATGFYGGGLGYGGLGYGGYGM